ncbi:MAG: hypothetical protein HOC09_05670 [Deltaproteobacteria bacterium]|nr:hypothetical protein [Deltaproteobacteria bacterium]
MADAGKINIIAATNEILIPEKIITKKLNFIIATCLLVKIDIQYRPIINPFMLMGRKMRGTVHYKPLLEVKSCIKGIGRRAKI